MYYPEGMKARVSPVQSIEPHRILAPTRNLNREPLGPQSRVVTTILPLHTEMHIWITACSSQNTSIVRISMRYYTHIYQLPSVVAGRSQHMLPEMADHFFMNTPA